MVHLLYAVAAFVCALVVLILPARTRNSLSKDDALDRAFLMLTDWTVIFCFVDSFWGVVASDVIIIDRLLVFASFLFHLSAAITPLIWLQFVLAYLGEKRWKGVFVGLSVGMLAFELTLLVLNFWNQSIYYVADDGTYHSGPMRQYLFYAQYITYVTIAIIALLHIARNKQSTHSRMSYRSVLAFVAAPILCGIFQQMYPDAPAYSIGYMLGCCIIYSFVVTEMLEARASESMQMSIANKSKTAFLNSMSHDIRTPLNAIMGFNGMAHMYLGKDNAKVKDCLDKIGRSSDALLTIINDVLEISRIEAGKVTITEGKDSVLHCFDNIEAMMQELADKAGISLTFSFGQVDNPYVYADTAHCGRVFTNLISNAIKYTPRGGSVQVHCEQTGTTTDGCGIYTFTFSDNGIGMSEEFQKQLFIPFVREQTATVSKIQGTGLGLALCKDLVEMMHGTITCSSRKGEGSTFTVVLPFRIQEGRVCTHADAVSTSPELGLEGRTVLLVEDNELNREIATAILEEMGARIVSADDGTVAVDIMSSAQSKDIDLILMDIQMPQMDGYEATRRIRALEAAAQSAQATASSHRTRIPIVAMTANAYDEDRRLALEAGMDEHVTKPIDTNRLREVLVRLVQS